MYPDTILNILYKKKSKIAFLVPTTSIIVTNVNQIWFVFFFKIFKIYSWEKERAETQAEGEAGSLQEAPCGTPSQDPVIMP